MIVNNGFLVIQLYKTLIPYNRVLRIPLNMLSWLSRFHSLLFVNTVVAFAVVTGLTHKQRVGAKNVR